MSLYLVVSASPVAIRKLMNVSLLVNGYTDGRAGAWIRRSAWSLAWASIPVAVQNAVLLLSAVYVGLPISESVLEGVFTACSCFRE